MIAGIRGSKLFAKSLTSAKPTRSNGEGVRKAIEALNSTTSDRNRYWHTLSPEASGATGQYGASFVTGVGEVNKGMDPTSDVDLELLEDGYMTADFDAFATPTTVTPEPGSFLLLGTGLLGAMLRKRIR